MLILAGVSINAIVGDNGIITNAQNANIKSGMVALEEFLQEKYVERYEQIENNSDDKIVLLRNQFPDYFYSPHSDDNVGNNDYVVYNYTNENGITLSYDLYLIKKSGLPEEIKSSLSSGEANGGGYKNYASLNDVYGVTSDLKVYYCVDGLNNIISLSNIEFTEDNPSKVIFNEQSAFAKLLKEDGGNVTANDLKKVKDIEIKADSGISSLNELYNFTSLTSLKLNGVTLSSLNGLENAIKISYIWIQDCTIGDYSSICQLGNKLEKLYIYLTPQFLTAQSEVDKLLSSDKGIQKGEFPNLLYFGIFGDKTYLVTNSTIWTGADIQNGVTDISEMKNFQKSTKNAIKYCYFQSCAFSDISCLIDFTSISTLALDFTDIKTFSGLQNMNKLILIMASGCRNLGIDEVYDSSDVTNDYGKNNVNDALSYLPQNTTSTISIRITSDKIKFISYINDLNLGSFQCGSKVLGENDVKKCVALYKNKKINIDSKYWVLFNDGETMDLKNQNLTNDSLKTLLDGNYTTVKYLRLDGNTSLTDNVSEGSTSLSGLLNSCTKMEALSLKGITGLTNVNFIQYMPNLVELNILDCSNIVDIAILETQTVAKKLTLKTLALNTYGTKTIDGEVVVDMTKTNDLTTIQTVISNFSGSGSHVWGDSFLGSNDAGGLISTNNIYKQLEKCDKITYLHFYRNFPTIDLNLTLCTRLSYIGGYVNGVKSAIWTIPYCTTSFDFGGTSRSPLMDVPDYDEVYGYCNLQIFKMESDGMNKDDFDYFFTQLSKCPSLSTISIKLRNYRSEEIDFSNLNFSDLTSNSLSKITITKYSMNEILKSVVGFNTSMTSLTTLNITNLASLNTIKDLDKLTALTSLTISNDNISDLTEIGKASNLTYLNLDDNSISDLYSLQNLHKLQKLLLRNNAIYDTSTYNGEVYYNLQILADLNINSGKNNKLTGLWLSGNTGITDYSLISSLNFSSGHDGF